MEVQAAVAGAFPMVASLGAKRGPAVAQGCRLEASCGLRNISPPPQLSWLATTHWWLPCALGSRIGRSLS